MGWFNKLKDGLFKSSEKITQGIKNIVTKRKLDDEILEELEELLITSDLGAEVAAEVTAEFGKEKFDKEITPEETKKELAKLIAKILEPVVVEEKEVSGTRVILVCGVNGNGKTTTIGKMAAYYQSQGKSVMMAACDTFRAAAVEQLKIWGDRNKCEVVTGPQNADPASVAFTAVEKAKNENIDILLIDTAGRLQNKSNLMEELSKISRVIKKVDNKAPHDTILVLDATTGQNAHSQLEKFKEIVDVNKIVVTKLDGTAKAGVVVALAKKFKTPIYAIGVGEGIDDLRPFKPQDFANNLMGI